LSANNPIVTSISIVVVTIMIFGAFPINAGSGEFTHLSSDSEAFSPVGDEAGSNGILPLGSESESLSPTGDILIWEAYAKGYSSITSSSDGLSYIITNSGSEDIEVDEYVLIMSPNPYQGGPENPSGSRWAQDGSLTFDSITAGSSLSYNYGDYVVGAFSPPRPPPPWWCTEDSEYTAPNVPIELTGEIMPFDLWDEMENPNGTVVPYDRGDIQSYASETQAAIWRYLRDNPSTVVGKTPMWELIPNIPTEVEIDLAVTNIGFQEASLVIAVDTLPSGYQLKSGSASPTPSSITINPDGSTNLKWNLGSMRGAIQTPDDTPTYYEHKYISYTLITPSLAPDERYFLPRAQVDKNADGIIDAHSEKPLLETYYVNSPPVAQINSVTINEGEVANLDGSSSYDPDEATGDYIVSYEWDLDLDGTTDATGPLAYLDCPDNGIYPVKLTVTDSYDESASAVTNVTVLNVAPLVSVDIDYKVVEVSLRVAGSKWSNVGMTLYEDDSPIGYIEVERWPGSPDDNPSIGGPTIPIVFDSGKIYKAVVTYDPYPDSGDEIRGDQPNNGKDKKDNAGNPVWVVLTTENETSTKIHHTFNTQQSKIRKSEHWNHIDPWEVELNGYLGDVSVALSGLAYDPGADDLTFTWAFDDGYVVQHHYPNSGGAYPVNILDSVNYSGSASEVTLTCEDDDGGVWVDTFSL
jgi:hypothetical protein